jgi:hypothetical protein
MLDITNIPPPRVALIDERTGLMSREWYRFFLSLFRLTGGGANDITLEDLQLGPLSQMDLQSETIDVQPSASQVAELQAKIQSMNSYDQVSAWASQFAEIQNQIQSINLSPAYTPELKRLRYGSFFDTTDQIAAAINTAYAMTFNSTDLSLGVTIGSPTSRIYVDTSNVYNIQFSAQLYNTAGGAHVMYIWLRKNGVDVANSCTQVRVAGNNTETVAAWNFLTPLNAGDYFELMYEVSDTSLYLLSDVASAVHPAIPSIILTVTDNISA